jgi:hypothetical protein
VISRRAVLGASVTAGGLGIAGITAHRGGVLDDGLRVMGIRPHTQPDPHDVTLLADAAQGQRELLALVDQITRERGDSDLSDIRRLLGEQLAAVSNDPESPSTPYPTTAPTPLPSDGDDALGALATRIDTVAAARADGAVSAGSVAVTKVLASMAAGLDQAAVTIRDVA